MDPTTKVTCELTARDRQCGNDIELRGGTVRHVELLCPNVYNSDSDFRNTTSGLGVRVVLLLACIALAAVGLAADAFFCSIVGPITGPSGACVADAKGALDNAAHGDAIAATAGASGNHQLVNLNAG